MLTLIVGIPKSESLASTFHVIEPRTLGAQRLQICPSTFVVTCNRLVDKLRPSNQAMNPSPLLALARPLAVPSARKNARLGAGYRQIR